MGRTGPTLLERQPWLKSPSAVTPSTRPEISLRSALRRPPISLVGADLGEFDAGQFAGKNVILNIFPSIDTPTCATSVRQFNERAAGMDETVVVCVSADLPFAMGRFCGAEGIENVKVGSTFRSDFGVGLRRHTDRRRAPGRARPRRGRDRSRRHGEAHRTRRRDRPGTELRRRPRRPLITTGVRPAM